jgi:hypothetical protein
VALARSPSRNLHTTRWQHTDDGTLEGAHSGTFDIHGDPDPDEPLFGCGVALSEAQALEIDALPRAPQQLWEISGIVNLGMAVPVEQPGVVTHRRWMELGRPVRWIEERGENLTAGAHARDQVHRIAIAATREGRILAVHDDAVVNFGAFNVLGLVVPYNTLSHLLGPYEVPHAAISVRGALTNTCFTTPYRGAGRPEAVFAMERIIDRLARRLELDPFELRMRNLVPAAGL